jgi:hypothetical protein
MTNHTQSQTLAATIEAYRLPVAAAFAQGRAASDRRRIDRHEAERRRSRSCWNCPGDGVRCCEYAADRA